MPVTRLGVDGTRLEVDGTHLGIELSWAANPRTGTDLLPVGDVAVEFRSWLERCPQAKPLAVF